MTTTSTKPSLFGIRNSNRDFEKATAWGKNQFNSSFPIALTCYMHHVGLQAVYLMLDDNFHVIQGKIGAEKIFGIQPDSDNLFFDFESDFAPYRKIVSGSLPRIDVVTSDRTKEHAFRALEVKLTALPDDGTSHLQDDAFGCEIVVRPDTVVYQALSLALCFENERELLHDLLSKSCSSIQDWNDETLIASHMDDLAEGIRQIAKSKFHKQQPLVLQPIWKTVGKSTELADNCLDVFVWSDMALLRLYVDETKKGNGKKRFSRPYRAITWLAKMLYDYSLTGEIKNPKQTIRHLSFQSYTDKAFAMGGLRTHKYMTCKELTRPRVSKSELKNIILGGGQKLLSPERRFDAIIANTPNLFLS